MLPSSASVTVHLFADGADTGKSAELSESNGWKYTWTGLDKLNAEGNEIAYTVSEDVPEGYTPSYSGSAAAGFVITNTKDEEFEDEEPPLYGEIEDDEPPLYGAPLTGDESNIPVWAGLSGLSLAGLAIMFLGRKKKKEDEE